MGRVAEMFSDPHEQQLREIKSLAVGFDDSTRELLRRVRDARTELAPPAEPLIAFVHVPKTVGAIATNMLATAYSRAALRDAGNYLKSPERTETKLRRRAGHWEEWLRSGGRATVGHVPYGLLRQYLPATTRYMTFLREPVDRVVSHYYGHIQRTGTERDKKRLERGSIMADSLEEALVELRSPELSNLATRFLGGNPSPLGKLQATALDDAKANLREFAFVGIHERLDESIVLLQRSLQLDLTPYVSRHATVDRPTVEELPTAERALIAEHNRLDMELYEFAGTLFENAAASAEEGLEAEVDRLQALSRDATDRAFEVARAWLDRELPPGTARPKAELLAAADGARVSRAALKDLANTSVDRELSDGQVTWARRSDDHELGG
jgi:hypothetical protein